MSYSSGRSGQKKALTKKELRQKRKIERTVGCALTGLMVILMAVFVGLLIFSNLVPSKWLIALGVIMVLIVLYVFMAQFTKAHMIGKVIAVIMSIIMVIGCVYLIPIIKTMDNIVDDTPDAEVMSVVVMASDPADSINTTGDYIYGIVNKANSMKLTEETLNYVQEKLGKSVTTMEFEEWFLAVDALYRGDVQAIIFNEGYRATMDENYITFSTDTKILGYKEIENKVDIAVPEKEITNECFTVFLSGIDSAGKLGTSGHSDVNIVAMVNPETHQVLLVTTPRDSWVKVYYGDGTDSGSEKDKLTHTGNDGIACTLLTMEKFYDIDIDYYAKINFTGLEKLVDALGGIEVVSDYDFKPYAYSDYPYTYVKGVNKLNGSQALIFARERHAFKDGDFQRSKNQVRVINAIIDKALSVTMLTNYTGIMDSLSDVLTTNIPSSQMSSLIKKQLADMPKWEIKSYTVTGATGMESCVSVGASPLSIVYPDEQMVAIAKAKMKALVEGRDPDSVTTAN